MIKNILMHLLVLFVMAGCTKKEIIFQEREPKDEFSEKSEQYIVVLKKDSRMKISAVDLKTSFESMESSIKVKAKKVFVNTINAVVSDLTRSQLVLLRRNDQVSFIEKDGYLRTNEVQFNPPYNLDRVDQEVLPLDGEHNIVVGDYEVNAYVIDTGVRVTHNEFENRALHGFDFVDNDADATDCNGHGTHVAGTLAGKIYGVAKNIKIHGVRVLGCRGQGQFSDVIAGIEWVTENHVKPAVANMSLGGGVSLAIDQAIQSSIESGVTYVVAAGNSSTNACNSSPARVGEAITVGSTTVGDSVSVFSNFGTCVDIFAPGSDIPSAWSTSDNEIRTISGTSMASPLVAGVAALYLSNNPNATPFEVKNALLENASLDRIGNIDINSPNRLISSSFLLNNEDEGDNDDSNDEDDNSDDKLLLNNGIRADLSGARSEELNYYIDVEEESEALVISISSGDGDADLYVNLGSEASTVDYDCRPFRFGNEELCEIKDPKVGRYHIMVRGYSAFSGLSLKTRF